MKDRYGLCAAMFTLTLLTSFEASASEILVEPVARTSQGYLALEFELVDPFEGMYMEALSSGLPTTLSFTLEIWRQRTGWWDRLEQVVDFEYRLFRDLLNEEYVVITEEEIRTYSTLDSLILSICRFTADSPQGYLDLPFRPAWQTPQKGDLSLNKTYYVTITANLAPLTVEDLNELDDWIRGTLQGRNGNRRGGISGLTRTMGGLLMSMTGFGDRTVRGRSSYFQPTEVRRTLNFDPQLGPELPVPSQTPTTTSGDSVAGRRP